jgi:hypothetical protein
MASPNRSVDQPKRRGAPARTPEARENQLISLAFDLAEKQLREGTASSQVITQFLKAGTTRERIEREILEKNRDLVVAKTEALKSVKNTEELFKKAVSAMRTYQGQPEAEYED